MDHVGAEAEHGGSSRHAIWPWCSDHRLTNTDRERTPGYLLPCPSRVSFPRLLIFQDQTASTSNRCSHSRGDSSVGGQGQEVAARRSEVL
jgi:hypothetical protein